jgi:hypothetical protein
MDKLFGGGSSNNAGLQLQQDQAAAQQRRTLAEMARQQAETDQAASGKVGRKSGSQLLTFLSGEGINKLGGA